MAEPFHGTDLYRLDSLLSEDERMVRDSVARWVDERWMPIVTEHYRNGTFPRELATEMGELGLFGSSLTGYGCPGLSHTIYGLAMEELELRTLVICIRSVPMYVPNLGSVVKVKDVSSKNVAGELTGFSDSLNLILGQILAE